MDSRHHLQFSKEWALHVKHTRPNHVDYASFLKRIERWGRAPEQITKAIYQKKMSRGKSFGQRNRGIKKLRESNPKKVSLQTVYKRIREGCDVYEAIR